MVEGGWCYDPTPEYEDGTTCFYCNLSLDGWEPKDDPREEHRRRRPICPFFTLAERYAASRPSKKGKKGRASAASKASRLSAQSNLTLASEAPSVISIDSFGEIPAVEDDSILTTATTATTTSKAGKGRKGVSKAKAGSKTKAPTARSKKTSTVDDSALQSQFESRLDTMDLDLDLEAPDAEATPEPPKKRTIKRTTKQEASVLEVGAIEKPAPKRTTRTRANSKLKTPQRLSEDQLQLQSEIEYALEASMHSEVSTPKPAHGVKRTSDGLPKDDQPVAIMDPSPKMEEAPAEKPKKGRKPKATKKPLIEPYVEPRSSELEEELQEMAREESGKKTKQTTSKAKRSKKAAQPEPEAPVETEQTVQEQAVELPAPPADHIQQEIASVQETPPAARDPQSPASPPPPTPTPAKIAAPSANRSSPVRPRTSNQRPQLVERTPSAASNASDEENVPPSAKPSGSARPALSTLSPNKQITKVPLAAATPSASPSKCKKLIGGLQSTFPWSATDLETIFLPSPTSNKLGRSSGFGFGSFSSLTETQKENLAELDRFAVNLADGHDVDLKEVVSRVKAALTSPEKKMSVQEWVKFNALRGEERLRGECERMVGLFEKEGGRALRALEGTACRE